MSPSNDSDESPSIHIESGGHLIITRVSGWKRISFSPKAKPHPGVPDGVLRCKSLTMTYFHRRTSTIIGAKAFHGPVRDGKGWDHLAMVVRRSRVERLTRCGWAHLGCASVNRSVRKKHTLGC